MKKKESEFLSWLLAQGCSLEGVKISRFEDSTGRGVQATRQIQAGEVLVKIPESLVITPDKSTASDALKRFGLGPSEFESPRLEKEALVLAVLAELAADTSSKWNPYLSALPPQPQLNCPAVWSQVELRTLCGCTALQNRMLSPTDDTEELPNMTDEHWLHIAVPFLEANPGLGFGTTSKGRSLYNYATALVAGYSFSLGRGGIQAMVPFWDFFNHAAPGEEGVRLAHESKSKTLQMIAIRDHDAGEQVFNSYGALGNQELLRRYGFVLQPNHLDSAFLHLHPDRLAPAALSHGARSAGVEPHTRHALRLLKQAGVLPDSGMSVAVPVQGTPPADLLEALRLLTADAEHVAGLGRALLASSPRRQYRPARLLRRLCRSSARHGDRVAAALAELADEALERQRQALEAARSATGVSTTRAELAAVAISGECRCLEALRDFARDKAAVQGALRTSATQVWGPLLRRRARQLRNFRFSPYHRYAHSVVISNT